MVSAVIAAPSLSSGLETPNTASGGQVITHQTIDNMRHGVTSLRLIWRTAGRAEGASTSQVYIGVAASAVVTIKPTSGSACVAFSGRRPSSLCISLTCDNKCACSTAWLSRVPTISFSRKGETARPAINKPNQIRKVRRRGSAGRRTIDCDCIRRKTHTPKTR